MLTILGYVGYMYVYSTLLEHIVTFCIFSYSQMMDLKKTPVLEGDKALNQVSSTAHLIYISFIYT